MCRGVKHRRKTSREIGELRGVQTETGERRAEEPWQTRVDVLSYRKEETQLTI